jgi:hypothetical protein
MILKHKNTMDFLPQEMLLMTLIGLTKSIHFILLIILLDFQVKKIFFFFSFKKIFFFFSLFLEDKNNKNKKRNYDWKEISKGDLLNRFEHLRT